MATEAGKVLVPGATAGTAAKFGTVLRGLGTAVTAVVGIDVVYSAFTGGFSEGFGFQGLTGVQSNGLLCDIQSLFGGGCEFAPAQSYIADGDVVVPLAPGWSAGNQVASCWYNTYGTRACVKTAGIAYAVSGTATYSGLTEVTVTGTVLASPLDSGNQLASWVHVLCRAGGADVVGVLPFTNGLPTAERTVTCTAGLDRVEIDGQDALSGDWSGADTPTAPVVSTWYPVGHPSRPIDPILDPQRWWVTTWKCDGGSPHTVTSSPWHETDADWPAPPMPSCDAGSVSEVTVTQTGEGVPDQTLYSWAADPTQTDWAATYPQCTNGSCTLELSRVDASTATRLACFDNPSLCADWFADPAKTEDYVCTYAGTDLALSECNMYSQVFDQTKRQQGGTIADPQTGEMPAGVVAPPVPVEDTSCPPAFTFTALFNPWYYYKGVVCAMQAAFVPPAGMVEGEVSATSELLSTRPPWSLAAPIGAMFTGISSGWSTGCSEMADFDPSHNHLRLPCNPPGSDSMVVLRWFITVALVVGTGFSVWHMLVAAIGGQAAD